VDTGLLQIVVEVDIPHNGGLRYWVSKLDKCHREPFTAFRRYVSNWGRLLDEEANESAPANLFAKHAAISFLGVRVRADSRVTGLRYLLNCFGEYLVEVYRVVVFKEGQKFLLTKALEAMKTTPMV
jgi:hypothetical protein